MRWLGWLVATLVGVVGTYAPAYAEDHDATVNPNATGLFVSITDAQDGESSSGSASSGSNTLAYIDQSTVCAPGGSQTCGEPALCDNGDIMVATTYFNADGQLIDRGSNCPVDAVADALPQVTPGLVLAALRRIGLPESELNVQPPNGRTLVNFDTNFYTDNGEFTRTVTLLGRQVELRIWPARYGWRFGDGGQRWTTTPGDRYPHLEITHRYLRKGRVSPSVDTTYAARFRVNGGPWRDVNGTVTIPGTPQGLRVVTARPVLVGD